MKAEELTFPDDHERLVITVYAFYPSEFFHKG